MKAYQCDICGNFHINEQDQNEFVLVVDEVKYNDMCNSCLNWLQRALHDRKDSCNCKAA